MKNNNDRAASGATADAILEREATNIRLSERRPSLYYVAVSEHGYGIHRIPAAAIRLAQGEVPAKAKATPLLVYEFAGEASEETVPIGWKAGSPTWPNGIKTRLVGLTTTHRLFVQSPRVAFE